MNDTPPPGNVRLTPPHARPFSRPQARAGEPTPLSTQAVLFVPGESPATFGPSAPELRTAVTEPSLAAWVGDAELVEDDDFPRADGPGPRDVVEAHATTEAQSIDPSEEPTSAAESEVLAVRPTANAHAEAVAQTLESLARRVRSGAVALPPWLADAGEAATLAGLLTVLLAPGPGVAANGRLVEDVASGESFS